MIILIIIGLFLIAHLGSMIPTRFEPREKIRDKVEYKQMGFYILRFGIFRIHFNSITDWIVFASIEVENIKYGWFAITICNLSFCLGWKDFK